MALTLSPPKIVLLAAHLAATGDVAGLASVAAGHGDVLHKPLLLRLLLTYLPAHLPTADYLPLLQSLDAGDFTRFVPLADPNPAPVETLSDTQAARKVNKLRLQHLGLPRNGLGCEQAYPGAEVEATRSGEDSPGDDTDADDNDDDDLVAFLIQRACAVDSGAGALPDLPALVAPFLSRSKRLRTWAVSTLLPLLRRNCEYYPDSPIPQTLADFEHLPDRLAVSRLLSQTGQHEEPDGGDSGRTVGRDLRGLVGPWLYNEQRWPNRRRRSSSSSTAVTPPSSPKTQTTLCPGWEETMQWLTTQASQPASWPVAIRAVEQWDGPADVDLGGFGTMWLNDGEQAYLERRYARAALASVYLVPDASHGALAGAHRVVAKIAGLLDYDRIPPLEEAISQLSPISVVLGTTSPNGNSNGNSTTTATTTTTTTGLQLLSSRTAAYFLRHDLLDEANPLTAPVPAATELLHALVVSASILRQLGSPHNVRQAADRALLQSGREQEAEAARVLSWIVANGAQSDDRNWWIKTREQLLWLRDWGAEEAAKDTSRREGDTAPPAAGVFGRVSKEFLEVGFLKALIAKGCYSLARIFYENMDHTLSTQQVQDAVFAAAMSAYDSASNPNRTRGGLKKCDEIIHAFPKTIGPTLPAARRVEALLAATHALSQYRLVLKQGEPFTPVMLRVHPDALAILGKVLEQNPRSYTKIQDLFRVAEHLVEAGLVKGDKHTEEEDAQQQLKFLAERRVTAMCIDAALNEDDFETAYSYVVSRLEAAAGAASPSSSTATPPDAWSWRAALAAGKYRRTERTVRPTHLGIAVSANLDIRHLEQRAACLATALRIAPADTLQEILNAYRRCEEELEAAVRAEDEQEEAWDDEADWASWQQQQQHQHQHRQKTQPWRKPQNMPGGFGAELLGGRSSGSGGIPLASRIAAQQSSTPASAAAAAAADDTPLSLFDLSRATARAAQRNLSALSNLRQTRQLVGFGGGAGVGEDGKVGTNNNHDPAAAADSGLHVRKRDQLREAAMGTLTSGVGWLIGAQPVSRGSSQQASNWE